ncbi:MAG TPA: hypothetical protein VGN00_14020 [Puia sp.]|jgi:hypothetical protein
MDKAAIEKRLSSAEALAMALMQEVCKTRELIHKEEVSTPSTERQPLTQAQLAAIGAKQDLRRAKARKR